MYYISTSTYRILLADKFEMGNEGSTEQDVQATMPMQSSTYCCLFFLRGDRVKLAHGDEQLRDLLRAVCMRFLDIAKIKVEGGILTVQAVGHPFEDQTVGDAIKMRYLLTGILKEFYANGWLMIASSNLARTESSTAVFFHKAAPEYPRERMVVVG